MIKEYQISVGWATQGWGEGLEALGIRREWVLAEMTIECVSQEAAWWILKVKL